MTIKWVVTDPLVMNGEPFCYGTRLTVRNILQRINPIEGARQHVNRMAEFEAHNLAQKGDVLVIQGVADVSNMGGISAQTGKRQGEIGAIGVFVIEKKFAEASAFALSGAVLTFFGFMHGESVGLAVTPTVAIAYVIMAVFLFALSRSPAISAAAERPEQNAVAATPAE